MSFKIDAYDDNAKRYADSVSTRDQSGKTDALGIVPAMLELLGEVHGLHVLDAGCGEGYLSRILDKRGAIVTGIDISPQLVEIARQRASSQQIRYQVADLCKPLPEYDDHFDAIASYLVLNDVYDHQGFAATLSAILNRGGRMVLGLNNPYSYVVRKHVSDYFASMTPYPYRGMVAQGLNLHFYHRTLEEYLDAFLGFGLRLTKLVDLPTVVNNAHNAPIDILLPEGFRFPYFMILAFNKP